MRPQTLKPASIVLLACLSLPASTAVGAQKDLTRTDRFPAPPEKVVFIDAARLDVRVRASDVEEIVVDTELYISGVSEDRGERWIESHTPTFRDDDETLRVVTESGKTGFLGFGLLSARARLAVLAPTTVIPDVTTTSGSIAVRGDFPLADPLRLRSSTGDIELIGAAATVDVRTASGDTSIEVVRPLDSFSATTSAGSVRLVGGSRQARVETASGQIWLDNLSGSAAVSTSTARITLRWDRIDPGQTVRVRTSSGRIQLVVPAGVRPSGELRTTNGNIRSDFPGEVAAEGTALRLTGDGPRFDVESASGEILLTTLVAWE